MHREAHSRALAVRTKNASGLTAFQRSQHAEFHRIQVGEPGWELPIESGCHCSNLEERQPPGCMVCGDTTGSPVAVLGSASTTGSLRERCSGLW
jgi:hypothetical protein